MQTKCCTRCGIEKSVEEFYRRKVAADGMRSECKACSKSEAKAWGDTNKERVAIKSHRNHALNKEKRLQQMKAWKAANPEAVKQHNAASRERLRTERPDYMPEYLKRYAAEINPAAVARSRVNYRTARKAQTPAWANDFFISEAYHLAKLREKVVGGRWEVDHIVPLQNPLVCGLHVENNLQVIPRSANRRKFNSYWPDMP